MRILAISGSLRTVSFNTALLRAAAILAPPGVSIELYGGLGHLPHFNSDLDTDTPPEEVLALRLAVGRAGGLLISSPEYAHGIAGSMKNALDWLVRSTEFPFKPVAILNASLRATHALAQLREILATMSAWIVEQSSITVPLDGRPLDAQGMVADALVSEMLRAALASFVDAIETGDPDECASIG